MQEVRNKPSKSRIVHYPDFCSFFSPKDSPRGGGGGSGKSFYSNKHQQNTWSFLRNRLVQAKMSDVFSNIRFTVNGKSIRALRCIGNEIFMP